MRGSRRDIGKGKLEGKGKGRRRKKREVGERGVGDLVLTSYGSRFQLGHRFIHATNKLS
jgi:hypothetical protein